MTYFITCVLFLYVLMLPDIALLRDRFPRRRWFYKLLSFGWNGTERQERILRKASAFLCIAVIPVAVSVHTVVSWVFGMQTQPMWHSTIFGPYFVVGAIYSGIAVIVLVAAILRKVYHLEDYLQPIHFNNLGLLLLTMALLWFYFTFAEYLTTVYGGGTDELAVFWAKFTGKYSPPFLVNGPLLFRHSFSHSCSQTDPNHLRHLDRFRLCSDRNVVRTLSYYHPYSESAQASLWTRFLHAVMGGVVNDGGSLCRIHTGHHPFFKVLSCHLDLGNRER